MRAILFDRDDAAAVADRLRSDGWQVEVVVERLAGEDDDEDHPWAVLTDAPPFLVEMLVEGYDGWLDEQPEQTGPSLPPLDLPAAPKRVPRPHED